MLKPTDRGGKYAAEIAAKPVPAHMEGPAAATAVLIGQPATCRRLARQLALMEQQPHSLGWVLTTAEEALSLCSNLDGAGPALGSIQSLESIMARTRPDLALICLPAAMKDLIASLRTRLRKLGVADRFIPTLEDLVAGVGPRTHVDVDLTALMNRPPRTIDEGSVRSVIAGKRVLITGAGGSIGSELARNVASLQPRSLIMVERSENALFEIDRQVARRWPELHRKALLHDVVDAAGTAALFRSLQPQVIFHAAAHKHVPMMEDHPAAAIDNNLFGTKSAADAADEIGAERFVLISTDKAVNPISVMGATKRLAELYVQSLNHTSRTRFSMVRFGNVLGSSGSVLETWARQIADGGPITVTDERMTRYFMTIPEAAALVIQSAALVDPRAESGEVFLLNMGQPVRIVELAKRFIELHGLTPVIDPSAIAARHGCVRIVFTGIRPGEKLHEELAFDAECMRPTPHPDIDIWQLPRPDGALMASVIESLAPARREASTTRLAAQIHIAIARFSENLMNAALTSTA